MNKDTAPRRAHLASQTISLQGRRQIADLCNLASRAVVRPKSMTPDQIQDVGWGLLMLIRKLNSNRLMQGRGLNEGPQA